MTPRRFPPPWTVEEQAACFVVRDHNGQQLAYVYFEDEPPGGSGTLSELQLASEYGKDTMIFVGEGNVGGKTSEDLQKEFPDVEIGANEQELRTWLKSRHG